MNCPEWEERIALYGEGDLPPNEIAETERHLARCSPCREFAEGLAQTLAIARAAHAEPIPPAAFTALRARVLAQIARGRRPWWGRLPGGAPHRNVAAWIIPLLAALAVAIVVLLPRPVEPLRTTLTPPPVPLDQPLAPATAQPIAPRRPPRARRRLNPRTPAEPLMVKLVTDDPNVVIYWIPN